MPDVLLSSGRDSEKLLLGEVKPAGHSLKGRLDTGETDRSCLVIKTLNFCNVAFHSKKKAFESVDQ